MYAGNRKALSNATLYSPSPALCHCHSYHVSLVTFVLFYASSSPQQIARRNLSAKTRPAADRGVDQQHGYDKPRWQQLRTHVAVVSAALWSRMPTAKISGNVLAQAPGVSVAGHHCFLRVAARDRQPGARWPISGQLYRWWGTFLCVLMMSIVYLVSSSLDSFCWETPENFPAGGPS